MCSGITRITVTVVVIMFELTGALTYILPTMVSEDPAFCAVSRAHFPLYSTDRPAFHQGSQRLLWWWRDVGPND
jgi:hypothetical protein